MASDKVMFEQEVICSACGHIGKMYLHGPEAEKFKTAGCRIWFKHYGWKLWLATFASGSGLGYLFGAWCA
jgi:hypothetical protein